MYGPVAPPAGGDRSGSPARSRRWWAPAPGPDLSPVTARRAYTEVLLVFAAFFAAGIVGASLLLAGRYRNLLETGSWADYSTQAVDVLAQIGLAVAVVLLLSARRGVTPADLGLRLPRRPDGRLAVSCSIRILAWGLFALIAGGIVNGLLQSGHLPTGAPTAPELVFGVVDSVQAGIIEELVVLAFVVVTLRQARRPWWEVTAVALVLRGSYHVYYGPGVVGIVLWAAIYYWTYLRFRELLPLMVAHAGWDTVGFLSQRWQAATAVAVLLVAAIWIAAMILWLVERNNQPALGWPARSWGSPAPPAAPAPPAPARAGPPPGWHPDPAGYNRWRWWDGQRWTEHVSPHR